MGGNLEICQNSVVPPSMGVRQKPYEYSPLNSPSGPSAL